MVESSAVVDAVLICSDEGCGVLYEARGPLEELEAWACDCGCSLVIVGGPYDVREPGERSQAELTLVGP